MNHQMVTSSSKKKDPNISKSSSTTKRILSALVVDDDPMIRRIHKAHLNKVGLETYVAENGKEAVELCRSGMHFDLILMDMEMPIMDGPKATRELRAMGVTSKIIGVTSRDLDSEKQAFLGAGLDGCFNKPLTSYAVHALFQELVIKD